MAIELTGNVSFRDTESESNATVDVTLDTEPGKGATAAEAVKSAFVHVTEPVDEALRQQREEPDHA
jgi:hypothetical protein